MFINVVEVIDSGINLSDHCPLILDDCISVTDLRYIKPTCKGNSKQLNFRWDKGDIIQCYHLTHERSCSIIPPVYLLSDVEPKCELFH